MRSAFTLAGLSVFAAACLSPVIERQCEKDADCGSGWRCIAATCISPGSGTGGGGTGTAGGSATGGGTTGTGGGSSSKCNASNCTQGCCASDVCIPTTVQNATNCGNAGNLCQSCGTGAVCKAGTCSGGTCDATTCPNGCCQNGQCIGFLSQNAMQCGQGGRACQACNGGLSCNNGLCGSACTAANCPNGCCNGNLCIPIGAQSPTACGRAGQACSMCGPGTVCSSGSCTSSGCGPQTCMGCCLGGMCAGGNDTFACGAAGTTCTQCASGTTCVGGKCQGCSPTTCPNGCCQNGFCQSGNLGTACGAFGQACTVCGGNTTCQQQRCTNVGTVNVGSPCIGDSDCASLSPQAFCKHTTSSGNGVYQNGYCTLRCMGNSCPGASSCVNLSTAGESDTICLASCASGGCRSPGYTCYSLGSVGNACWIFPLPSLPDAGVPPPQDAGMPQGRLTGAACTADTQCRPPNAAFCLPPTLGGLNTGYTGGYCSRTCSASVSCPAGALCITEQAGTMLQTTSCKELCTNPGGGQGSCRAGYNCIASPTSPALGWCGPKCFNQSLGCPAGTMCNASTGYCQ